MNSSSIAITAGFWISLGLVAYSYLAYPGLIWALSRWLGREPVAPDLPAEKLPTISVLIAAHNEEAMIEATLQSILAMDYPAEKLQVVVASDGSTDGTADVVRRFATRGVTLLNYTTNRGKAAVLNASVPQLSGDVFLLSDANTRIEPSAAKTLVRWFAEPEVGAVCGRLVLTDPVSGRNVDSLYWKYETFLKKREGRIGALLGANGAIYAIRRELYCPIPEGTIVDDFVIPLLAKLKSDCTIVYESEAVAYEETPDSMGSEFRRRARIGAGGYQSLGILWRLLDPRRGWVAFSFLSHKVLRWLSPFFLIGGLVLSAILCDVPFYGWAFLAQVVFYGLSLLMAYVPSVPRWLKPLRLGTMFTSMNAALFVGFCRWILGTQGGTWQRTARLAELQETA